MAGIRGGTRNCCYLWGESENGLIIREMERGDYDAVASLIRNELGYSMQDEDAFSLRMDLMAKSPICTTFIAQ